ncbi:fruit protein pKIWI502-like [Triticum dicoccoides]|uniref:fruit protein pKIWI502-like n=1 Tax=Triticum dicoccoides TaxID=85692 RepID=UPI00188DF239|nr:fruit protein pKIWI502-like [Triticum dicoccoides]
MASAMAATCMLLRPAPCTASASPVPVIPFLHRRPRSLTTACAVVTTPQQQQGAIQKQQQNSAVRKHSWTAVPVSAIAPATEDQSMCLITLDLSGAPDLVAMYTTPGQYLLTHVPLPGGPPPAFMCISSAPHSGLQFELLVRSVPGTTSEKLCKLHVGNVVQIGPVTGTGFAIQNINPPEATQKVVLFAAAEGISPIRALIESGFSASERADVRLYYAAKDMQSMPYQERFKKWEETGVKVVPLTLQKQKVQEPFLEHTLNGMIGNPLSTGAVIVGPLILKEVITGVLLDHGVRQEKILTIDWNPEIEPSTLDAFGLNGLGLIKKLQAPTMDTFTVE